MAFAYHGVDALRGAALVGSGRSTELVQRYIKALESRPISEWKRGRQVVTDHDLDKGTAIAAFSSTAARTGFHLVHAAFLLKVVDNGIWILDQWPLDPVNRPVVKVHLIPLTNKHGRADYYGLSGISSNIASEFYTIEL